MRHLIFSLALFVSFSTLKSDQGYGYKSGFGGGSGSNRGKGTTVR